MKKIIWIVLTAAVLLLCVGCGAKESGETEIVFFKAGKADASVILHGDDVIMIDTGLRKNADELIEALDELGVDKIDVLIISHFDKDHVGGAAEILRACDVGIVYQSNSPKDSDEYEEYLKALEETGTKAVTVTDTTDLRFGSLTVSIDGPEQDEYTVDPSNNSSLITTVAFGTNTVLFAGDAEDLRITEFLEDYERAEGSLILKVPYHGHMQQTLSALVEAAAPDAAVIPCSKSEPDADDREQAEAVIASSGAEIYRTFEGDILVTLTTDGWSVLQE